MAKTNVSIPSPPDVSITLEQQREFSAAAARGRAQIAAGRAISGNDVAEWVASWDSENELPRPLPR